MNFFKRIVVSSAIVLSFSSAGFCASVGIVANLNTKATADVVNGFKSTARANSGAVSFTAIDPSAALDTDFGAYDLIFVSSSDKVKAIALKTTKPVIFAMVYDPVEKGVVASLGPSGKNITGVSLDVSVEYQAKMIKDILPSAKRVGVFYSGKTAALVEKARTVFPEQGLNLKATSVQSFSQIPPLVSALKGSVDIFWCLPDTGIYTPEAIGYILKNFTDNKVPVFGFSANVTKAGALFSYAYDFDDIGRQAGEIAVQVLSGTDIGTIPIASPRRMKYTFNNKIKDLLGISINSDTWSQAADIY